MSALPEPIPNAHRQAFANEFQNGLSKLEILSALILAGYCASGERGREPEVVVVGAVKLAKLLLDACEADRKGEPSALK